MLFCTIKIFLTSTSKLSHSYFSHTVTIAKNMRSIKVAAKSATMFTRADYYSHGDVYHFAFKPKSLIQRQHRRSQSVGITASGDTSGPASAQGTPSWRHAAGPCLRSSTPHHQTVANCRGSRLERCRYFLIVAIRCDSRHSHRHPRAPRHNHATPCVQWRKRDLWNQSTK